MPYIKRKQVKAKQVEYKKDNRFSVYYNSSEWRRLRQSYYRRFPLCKICLDHGVVKQAVDVHHVKPFDHAVNEADKWSLLLCEDNLISLCSKCHAGVHMKINRYSMTGCSELTDKEYNEAHRILDDKIRM